MLLEITNSKGRSDFMFGIIKSIDFCGLQEKHCTLFSCVMEPYWGSMKYCFLN